MASSRYGPPLVIRAKVGLVGESKAGKTAFRKAVCAGEGFNRTYDMTIGTEVGIKTIPIPDRNVLVELHLNDFGNDFGSPPEQSVKNAELTYYLGFYDVASPESLMALDKWFSLVMSGEGGVEQAHKVGAVVGTKIDQQIPCRAYDAVQWSKERNMEHFETSAAMSNVIHPIEYMAQMVVNNYDKRLQELSQLI